MYPWYGRGGQVPMMREVQNKQIQHDTDIDRLMRLLQQLTQGEIFGGDPSAAIPEYPGYGPGGGGGGSSDFYDGETTSNLSRATHPWTGSTTCTAEIYDEDPSSLGNYAGTGTTVTITNRDTNLAIISGTVIQVRKVTTGQGNIEYRITWVSR